MAHPALMALVTEFFYAPSSLGSAFPEVFSREVPRVAVCLAATAVCRLHPFCYLLTLFCSFELRWTSILKPVLDRTVHLNMLHIRKSLPVS